jgi:hypothetical protein
MREHKTAGGRVPAARFVRLGRLAALGVVVSVALSCVAASAALANPEWLLNGKALTAQQAIEWKNQSLTMEYGGGGDPETFEVTCKTSGEGDAYPPTRQIELEGFPWESKVKVTNVTFSGCEIRAGACTKLKLEGYAGGSSPVLVGEASKVLIEPRLFTVKVQCEAGREKFADECLINTKTLVTNESTGVLASLEGNNLACTGTKEGSSWLHGKITLKATGSSKLSVS